MNRRSLLSFIGLAPFAAMPPVAAKAEAITVTLKADATALQSALEQLEQYADAIHTPPDSRIMSPGDAAFFRGINNPAYAVRDCWAAAGFETDDESFDEAAAYCDELVPVEHEDEMAGG